jgi:hypothetical protein
VTVVFSCSTTHFPGNLPATGSQAKAGYTAKVIVPFELGVNAENNFGPVFFDPPQISLVEQGRAGGDGHASPTGCRNEQLK